MPAIRSRALRLAIELLLVLIVVGAAIPAFGRAPTERDGDEAMWLGTTHFFLTLFVRHDISADSWPVNYWTLTHPMMVRYILGGWLWAHGYGLESLDPAYDHSRKWTTNVEMGKAPDRAMLDEARRIMRGLAVVCTALVYGVVRVLAGRLGGLAAGLLVSGSPYLLLHFTRAKGETPLMLFLLAALLANLIAIKRAGARGPSIGWGVLAGVLLGLAIGSKLTAILVVPAIVLWIVWAAVGGVGSLARLVTRQGAPTPSTRVSSVPGEGEHERSPDWKPTHSLREASVRRGSAVWGAGLLLIAAVTFIAINPFLYRDPIGRAWLMLTDRQREMSWQADVDPSRAVTTAEQRIKLVWRWSLNEDTWGDSRLRWPIEAPLAILGAVWLAVRALRHDQGAEVWLLLWTACIFGGVTWGLGYLLDHYFVPTAVMSLILVGLAVGWTTSLAGQMARQLWSRRRQRELRRSEPAIQKSAVA
jgi:hypothetical protein